MRACAAGWSVLPRVTSPKGVRPPAGPTAGPPRRPRCLRESRCAARPATSASTGSLPPCFCPSASPARHTGDTPASDAPCPGEPRQSRYEPGSTSPRRPLRHQPHPDRRARRRPVLLNSRPAGVRLSPVYGDRVLTGQDLGHRLPRDLQPGRYLLPLSPTPAQLLGPVREFGDLPARRPLADRVPPATTPSPPPRPRPGTRRSVVRPRTATAHGITSSLQKSLTRSRICQPVWAPGCW